MRQTRASLALRDISSLAAINASRCWAARAGGASGSGSAGGSLAAAPRGASRGRAGPRSGGTPRTWARPRPARRSWRRSASPGRRTRGAPASRPAAAPACPRSPPLSYRRRSLQRNQACYSTRPPEARAGRWTARERVDFRRAAGPSRWVGSLLLESFIGYFALVF